MEGPIENNHRTKKFATENHHKKGNNYFTYPVLTLPHRFLCCIWGFQCSIVEIRLEGKISHSVVNGHLEIIEEYKNWQREILIIPEYFDVDETMHYFKNSRDCQLEMESETSSFSVHTHDSTNESHYDDYILVEEI